SVAIDLALVHDTTLPGDDGGLTVSGGGTLTLPGTGITNTSTTFTGNTTVASGTNLIIGSATGTGSALQTSRIATIPGATGLEFSSTLTSHAFAIGGFSPHSKFNKAGKARN